MKFSTQGHEADFMTPRKSTSYPSIYYDIFLLFTVVTKCMKCTSLTYHTLYLNISIAFNNSVNNTSNGG